VKTTPGELPADEAAALLEPFEEFAAFVNDMTTIRVVTELTELSREGHAIVAFNLINTAGSGGGVGYGESGFAVLSAELSGPARPPLRIVRRGFGANLAHLFSRKVRVDDARFEDTYFVVSQDADGARGALPPDALAYLGRHRPDVALEIRGHRLVAHRRGTVSGEEQARFVEALAPLVPLLARAGYRG
jgi:hypothetical protein